MNAGCYGCEIVDSLSRVTVLDSDGSRLDVAPDELEASYRETVVAERGWIVLVAEFGLAPGDAAAALERIGELNRRRWESLPSGVKNAGSIFRNPDGEFAGRLLEACDLKGLISGDAMISEKHANVIINRGSAASLDIVRLMAEARRRVRRRFAVELEPELVMPGGLRATFDRLSRAEDERPEGASG